MIARTATRSAVVVRAPFAPKRPSDGPAVRVADAVPMPSATAAPAAGAAVLWTAFAVARRRADTVERVASVQAGA